MTIPESVKLIGLGAFGGCSRLKNITLPFVGKYMAGSGGTYQYPFGWIFGTSAYTGGIATTQHYYGSSTSYTISSTYYIPSSLEAVTITGGNILRGAFYNCKGLISINISQCSNIGVCAFYNCNKLKSMILPDTVTSVESSAFNGCAYINNINLPNSVTSIGTRAFSDCVNLSRINIPKGVVSIMSGTFQNCSSLYSVTLTDRVVNIANSAFCNCASLTSITIPNNVLSIEGDAFEGCYKLVEVYNKSSLTITAGSEDNGYVGYYAKNVYTEEGGSKLSTDSNGYIIYTDGENKILIGYTGTETELTLPNGITEINRYAFCNCTDLTSVTIPASVTSMGSYVFSKDCTGLIIKYQGDSIPEAWDENWNAYGYTVQFIGKD